MRRRDAARIILQEIRQIESTFDEFRKHGSGKKYDRTLMSNGWKRYIHLFAGTLTSDELDAVTDLYKLAEYYDDTVQRGQTVEFNLHQTRLEKTMDGEEQKTWQMTVPWLPMFMDVLSIYRPIYHSEIGAKFKQIARTKF